MEYAIISLNNNQHLVKPGSRLTTLGELGKVGDEVKATTLLVKDGEVSIGNPTVDYPITLKIVEISKTDKIDVFKYKSKSRYRRHTGHRQPMTVLEVVSKAAVKEAPVKRTKKAEK